MDALGNIRALFYHRIEKAVGKTSQAIKREATVFKIKKNIFWYQRKWLFQVQIANTEDLRRVHKCKNRGAGWKNLHCISQHEEIKGDKALGAGYRPVDDHRLYFGAG